MRHGSLFSGIGGFDLAAEWMGWENMFHCEWNPFGQKVLNYYWPNAKSYGDITKTDFTEWRGKIDIVTGGFPCQPYSTAGKRKGKEDERHLWPEMLRAIGEIQPTWIVGENVPGLLNWERGMVLAEIKADLEAAGFEVFPPVILPACGKNAPHRRDRLWIVAYAASNRRQWEGETIEKENRRSESGLFIDGKLEGGSEGLRNVGLTSDTKEFGCRIPKATNEWGEQIINNGDEVRNFPLSNGEGGDATNSSGSRLQANDTLRKSEGEINTSGIDGENLFTDTHNQGLQGSKINGGIREVGQNGNKQPSRFIQSTWEKFPTQSPICSGDDGLSSELDGITLSKWRKESLMGAGNAIVPQVAYEIFKAIAECKK